MRTVYVNGKLLREDEAVVSVFDRGFLMADGIYELTAVIGGKILDFDGHIARLERSAKEIDLTLPLSGQQMLDLHRLLIQRNELQEGAIYTQITRGNPGDRDFLFPDPSHTPATLVMFTQAKPGLADNAASRNGIRVVTQPDNRWKRRDIKTIQLLSATKGKSDAQKSGADDAWFVEDGYVTEGTASNAYIVSGGKIITRSLGHSILGGITRSAVLRLVTEIGMSVDERPFTVEEAKSANEAFSTSASSFVLPVVAIDDTEIGTGVPGPISRRLREIYLAQKLKTAR